jgi:hypothetical protein
MRRIPLTRAVAILVVAGAAGLGPTINGQGLPGIVRRLALDIPALTPFIDPAPLTAGLDAAVSGIGIAVLDLAEVGFTPASAVPRDPDGILLLRPGAWELLTESVSLLPGSTATVQAEGYVLAPMSGARAALVQAVLTRAYRTPDIALNDVKTVVWAIATRARISSMAPAFRGPADRLLTDADRTSLDASALGPLPDDLRDEVRAKLPPALAAIVIAESDLRRAFADPGAGFAELERLAVTAGEPESIMGDKDLLVERWSYHPDGYFARFVPTTFQRTAIHVVVPSGLRPAVQRDAFGRVARVAYPNGLAITAEYDDAISALGLPGDPGVKGYAFKTMSVSQPDPSRPGERRTATVQAVGWTLVGTPNNQALFGTAVTAPTVTNPRYTGAADHYQAGTWIQRGLGFVSGDKENAAGQLDVDPEAIDETYFRDAAGQALAGGAADVQWARTAIRSLTQSFDWVHCAMPGRSCQRSDAPAVTERAPVRFNPANSVAVPGRQGSQRLGFTGRVLR